MVFAGTLMGMEHGIYLGVFVLDLLVHEVSYPTDLHHDWSKIIRVGDLWSRVYVKDRLASRLHLQRHICCIMDFVSACQSCL